MRRQGGRGRAGISRFARDGGGLRVVGKVPKFLLDIEAQHPGILGKTAVGSLPGGPQQQGGGGAGAYKGAVDPAAAAAAAAADDGSADDPVEQEAFQRALVEQGLDENGNPLAKRHDGSGPPPAKRRPAPAPAPPRLVAGAANTKLKSLSSTKQPHTASNDAARVNRSLLSFSVGDDGDGDGDDDEDP